MLHPARYDAHFVVHVGICDRIRWPNIKMQNNNSCLSKIFCLRLVSWEQRFMMKTQSGSLKSYLRKGKMLKTWMYTGWNPSTDHIVPSLVNLCCLHWGISFPCHRMLQFACSFPFFSLFTAVLVADCGWPNMKAFERFSKVWITLPWCFLFSLPQPPPPPLSLSLPLSHTSWHHFIFIYFIIIRIPNRA